MYRSHVSLVYNLTGRTVEFYPPAHEVIADGAPASAATYKVWSGTQSNDDTPKFSGTATLDSTSTNTQSIAGPSAADRSYIQVSSTSGFVVGRRYLLTNNAGNGGQRMIFIPKKIDSSGVFHENDILTEYFYPATLIGLRHSFVVDSTFISTLSNINVMFGGSTGLFQSFANRATSTDSISPPYRVEWSYTTAGGIARKQWTTFDVCRAPLKHNVTIENVRASMPDVVWREWVQQQGADFYPQIDEAFQRVISDIRMAGYDPNAVTDPQVVDRLVTLAARAVIGAAFDKDQDGKLEAAYVNLFNKSIGTGLKAWMSVDSSGAVTVDPARQLWLTR